MKIIDDETQNITGRKITNMKQELGKCKWHFKIEEKERLFVHHLV